MPIRQIVKKISGLILGFVTGAAAAALPTMNMTPGVTPISQDIYDLHMTILWICIVIGVVVFSVMFYTLFAHRKSRGYKPATFHENIKIEILWAVIPLLILLVMAIPATKTLIRMADDSEADVNIKVTGYQWKWKYEYLDNGISYFSNLSTPYDQLQNYAPKNPNYLLEVDKPLVIPIHKKIRFLVTSNDVIHSWWVPALGIKRDAIPGFIHEAWARVEKPGIYRGQCAELCGLNHGYMPIVVQAVTEEQYQQWIKANAPKNGAVAIRLPSKNDIARASAITLASAKPSEPLRTMTKAELIQKGENVYLSHCAMCHKPNGAGMPPAFPALKGSQIATGPIAEHINVVLNGKKGTAMQAFGQQLSDSDIAAVISYERNAWGNSAMGNQAGGIVQPADVAAAHKNGKV